MLKTPEYPHFRNSPLNAEPKGVQRLGYCTNTKTCFHSKSRFIFRKSTFGERIPQCTQGTKFPSGFFGDPASSISGTMVLTWTSKGPINSHRIPDPPLKKSARRFDVAWPGQPVTATHNFNCWIYCPSHLPSSMSKWVISHKSYYIPAPSSREAVLKSYRDGEHS